MKKSGMILGLLVMTALLCFSGSPSYAQDETDVGTMFNEYAASTATAIAPVNMVIARATGFSIIVYEQIDMQVMEDNVVQAAESADSYSLAKEKYIINKHGNFKPAPDLTVSNKRLCEFEIYRKSNI